MNMFSKEKLASMIDHTLLKQNVSNNDILALCSEAVQNGFASVCILPGYVVRAAEILKGTEVKVCSVAGFPLGAVESSVKIYEVQQLIYSGAREIDIVLNLPAFFNKDYARVVWEMKEIKKRCEESGSILKVIIETCLMNEEQKINAAKMVSEANSDFIKTSTGFSTGGATAEDIKLLRMHSDTNVKVKASGGIRDYDTAIMMIEAGADRIGTSSGIKIVNGII